MRPVWPEQNQAPRSECTSVIVDLAGIKPDRQSARVLQPCSGETCRKSGVHSCFDKTVMSEVEGLNTNGLLEKVPVRYRAGFSPGNLASLAIVRVKQLLGFWPFQAPILAAGKTGAISCPPGFDNRRSNVLTANIASPDFKFLGF